MDGTGLVWASQRTYSSVMQVQQLSWCPSNRASVPLFYLANVGLKSRTSLSLVVRLSPSHNAPLHTVCLPPGRLRLH